MFLDDLKDAAFNKCGLTTDQVILVGVSGGADSLAMLLGLKRLGFLLKIAHLDHGLRKDSREDADFVEEFALSHRISFVRERINVGQVAEDEGQSIEEAARNIRYQFLFEQARAAQAQAVAVGHHADDQVETVLMHFLRGSALPGLTGMSFKDTIPLWDGQIPLVRPMLGIWRKEIDAYLDGMDVSPRIDDTNRDVTYFRNKLRHVLIPRLEEYNPQIKQVLWRMSDVLKGEDGLIEDLTQKAWKDCFLRQNEARVILYLSKFIEQPKAIQRRMLRKAVSQLRPDLRDIGYEAVERAIDFSSDPSQSGEMDMIARLNIAKLADYLIIKTWESDLPDWQLPLLPKPETEMALEIDQPVPLRHGWQLEAAVIKKTSDRQLLEIKGLDPNEAWLDYGLLQMPLLLRSRRAGDRWQPFGMENHTQKLKDFFINEKIPEHLRDVWPLICSGEEIAWVVGLRPSEVYKITQKTKQILHLRLVRKIA